jgi:serine protease inhibitor
MRLRLRAGCLFTCLILLFAFTISSCHKDVPAPQNTPLDLPSNSGQVVLATNDFAINIFRAMLAHDPGQNNKLISPLSIYTCMSMVYNGSANTTRDSMTKALSLAGISLPQLNAVSRALIQQMPKEDNKVQLSIANSIWYDQRRAQPLPGFLDTVQRDYLATVQSLDFLNPGSVNTINSWVSSHTNGKIPSIIQDLSSSDIMVLVNAVYFNGAWKNSFKTDNTHNDAFYKTGGARSNVPFMSQTASFRAYTGSGFRLLELPYGTGKAFDMYLLLPANPSGSILDFARSLDRQSLAAAFSGLDSINIDLRLPKWEYRYNIDQMGPHLTDLGMGVAFGTSADFSNMFPPSVGAAISKVIHKTYVKVSEEGTEAAAATGTVMTTMSTLPSQPTVWKFDHPFVYLITEQQTGSIFFMGIVNDPAAN